MYQKPPRAEKAIRPDLLPFYEGRDGWIAQIKKNGTYLIVVIKTDGLVFYTRHGDHPKAWKCPPRIEATLMRLASNNGPSVLCAELMHSKVPGIRDTLYFHDIMVEQGEPLRGTTYAQRYSKLQSLLFSLNDAPVLSKFEWGVAEGIFLLRNIRSDFLQTFQELSNVEDEGLVLKNQYIRLHRWTDDSWTKKSRKETKVLSC